MDLYAGDSVWFGKTTSCVRPLLHHQTVRPFVFRDIELADELTQSEVERNEDAVEEKLEQIIREMIDESKEHASTKSPLLRLRVEYVVCDRMIHDASAWVLLLPPYIAHPTLLSLREQSGLT